VSHAPWYHNVSHLIQPIFPGLCLNNWKADHTAYPPPEGYKSLSGIARRLRLLGNRWTGYRPRRANATLKTVIVLTLDTNSYIRINIMGENWGSGHDR